MAIAPIVAFFVFDLGRYLTLDALRGAWVELDAFCRAYPVRAVVLFVIAYLALAALSLPGSGPLSLVGGALFGSAGGTAIVSLASAVGATVAFSVSRFLLRDIVQRRFGRHLRTLNRRVDRDGAYYLFALRMVPGIPHGPVNLLAGLTSMRALTFYLTTQMGVLPACMLYVNAGTRLASLDSPDAILSPAWAVTLSLAGLLPLAVRGLSRVRL